MLPPQPETALTIEEFCRRVIDLVASQVAVVKQQASLFERLKGRIESVQLGCSDNAIERRGTLAAGLSSHEKVILSSDGNSSQRPFG
jgi:hypothetical protein